MKRAVLFDLGGTLAHYFERAEFPGILEQAIAEVRGYLRQQQLLRVSAEAMWQAVQEEDHEAPDYRVRPLEERLIRIFQLGDPLPSSSLILEMCRCFTRPMFATGRCYEDALPALHRLRSEGFQTAIVSNTPWGSPAALWREEVERLGLGDCVDAVVFCRDAGWRKPARPIFDLAIQQVGAAPGQCLFVGDDPRWDLAGPRAAGMEAILIDRRGTVDHAGEDPIRTLHELWDRLQVQPN